MSEEITLSIIRTLLRIFKNTEKKQIEFKDVSIYVGALQNILDLYNKEKEKNKEFENTDTTTLYADGVEIHKKIELYNFISKDKIREVKDKLINFEFKTDDYKDLDFISEIINDLKELLEE